MIFKNRKDAGLKLAEKLTEYAGRDDVLILALPRDGIPVAYEVAEKLNAPLDVFFVRKLGVPGQEELAMGAIASNCVRVLNESTIAYLNISEGVINRVAEREQHELELREKAYRDNFPAPEVRGKTVILIDDGLATGATMRAAAIALKQQNPQKLVIAVPVSSAETCAEFRDKVDAIICATTPRPFYGVGMWYHDFSQTTDEEVSVLLEKSKQNLKTFASVKRA